MGNTAKKAEQDTRTHAAKALFGKRSGSGQ